jgi:hypothetical protein
MHAILKLTRAVGNLPVRVTYEDGKTPVAGAEVTIWTHEGRYLPSRKTDREGDVMFNSIPFATYTVSGRKGKYPTDKKVTTVNKPGVSPAVHLTISTRKEFKIRVARVGWSQIAVGAGVHFVDADFDIWDLEGGIKGKYSCRALFGVASVSPSPIGGGETVKPGKWKSFTVPRPPGAGKEVTGVDFAAPADIRMSTAGISLQTFLFSVVELDIGEGRDEDLDIPGLFIGGGKTDLTFRGSTVFDGP